MIRHSEAIEAWEQVFQPTRKEAKKTPVGNGLFYLEINDVPTKKYSYPKFPFWQVIESSRTSSFSIMTGMGYLYEYFKTLSEHGTRRLSFRQAQRIWLSIYPHIPTKHLINKSYGVLLEYFSHGLNFTPIDIGRGRSLKSL